MEDKVTLCDWCHRDRELSQIWDEMVCEECINKMVREMSEPVDCKRVRCTRCGHPGPGAETIQEALALALEEEFVLRGPDETLLCIFCANDDDSSSSKADQFDHRLVRQSMVCFWCHERKPLVAFPTGSTVCYHCIDIGVVLDYFKRCDACGKWKPVDEYDGDRRCRCCVAGV